MKIRVGTYWYEAPQGTRLTVHYLRCLMFFPSKKKSSFLDFYLTELVPWYLAAPVTTAMDIPVMSEL
ncbi:hypothetical protein QQG55_9320 [Brugia pahangi]